MLSLCTAAGLTPMIIVPGYKRKLDHVHTHAHTRTPLRRTTPVTAATISSASTARANLLLRNPPSHHHHSHHVRSAPPSVLCLRRRRRAQVLHWWQLEVQRLSCRSEGRGAVGLCRRTSMTVRSRAETGRHSQRRQLGQGRGGRRGAPCTVPQHCEVHAAWGRGRGGAGESYPCLDIAGAAASVAFLCFRPPPSAPATFTAPTA